MAPRPEIYVLLLLTNILSNYYTQAQTFTIEPKDTYVRAGRTIWWHCSAEFPDGGPILYSWMFNGVAVPPSGPQHVVFSNGTLRLDVIQTENEGQYYCIADNGINRITSRLAQLTIAYIAPVFDIQPSSQSPNVGVMVRIECAITSQPPAEITWLHNDQPVPRDMVAMVSGRSQLTIQSVGYEDGGRYQCMGRNPLTGETKYSKTAVLTPTGGPVWSVEPEPQTVNKDSVVYIDCVAFGNPTPSVSWYHVQGVGQETVIENDNRFVVFPNGTLRIADVKPVDAGFYKCQANNDVDTISKTVLITISEIPKTPVFTSYPTNLTVKEGDEVNWFCGATGEPVPTVSWRREGQPLAGNHISFPSPGSLHISPAQREDKGWYICEASSLAGYNTKRAFLDVQYPPTIKDVMPSVMVVQSGSQVHIPCVTESNPEPEIRWLTPRGEVTDSSGVVIYSNGSLIISQISAELMGKYTCEARNYLGLVSQSVDLQVTSKPVFLSPPSDVSANIGMMANLDCLAVGYPTPVTSWILPNNTRLMIQNGLNGREYVLSNGSLVISNIQVEDEGLYTCLVENELGTISASAIVKVQGPPVFNPSQYSVIKHLGESLLLNCNPMGRPKPVVQWAKDEKPLVIGDGIELFENNSLYVNNISREDYGQYRCYAANQAGAAVLEIDVLQPDAPVFTVRPVDVNGNVSEPLQVPCQAQSVLTPDISWYRTTQNGHQLIANHNVTMNLTADNSYVTDSGTLVFSSLSPEDEGYYACVAENSMGNITANIFINVQVPPVITVVNNPTTGDVGMSTTLLCQADGDPVPATTWTSPRGQTIMFTNDQYIVEKGLITIKVTNIEEHMGQWSCKACNILGCDEKSIDVFIRGPPVITSVDGYVDGSARVLICRANGTPYPEIHYYWGDLAINPLFPPRGHSIDPDGPSLRIQFDITDSVSYKCRATNSFGSDMMEFTVPSEPLGISLLGVASTKVMLTWFLPNILGGLPELNYTVEYRKLIPNTNIQVVRHVSGIQTVPYILENLEAFTEYTFRVAAYNILGMSPFTSAVSAKTKEDAPDPVQDLYLTFAGESVHVTWNQPAKMNGNISNIEYTVVASDALSSNVYHRVTVKQGQPLETFLTNPIMYGQKIVVSVTAVNVGIGLASVPVTEQFTVKHKVPFLAPFLTHATSMGPHSVNVQWTYPQNEGDISGFYIRIIDEDKNIKKNEERVNGYEVNQFIIKDLDERTQYAVSVAAFSKEGKGPYSGEKLVITGYEILSQIPYLNSQKLSISGTKLAIILGSISGILLFLVILLLIWQWARLNRKIRDKMIDDAYRAKPRIINVVYPGPYPQTVYEARPRPPTDAAYQAPKEREKSQLKVPASQVSAKKEPERKKSSFYKPRRRLYGPGRSFVYKVSPRGKTSPTEKRIYRKQRDPEPVMAFSEIEVYPSTSTAPPKVKGQRAPGHPTNPRNARKTAGQPVNEQPSVRRPVIQQTKLSAVQENLANQKSQKHSTKSPADVRAARVRSPPKRSQPLLDHQPQQKAQGKPHTDDMPQQMLPAPSRLHEAHPLPNEGSPKLGNKPLVQASSPADEPIYAIPWKGGGRLSSPMADSQSSELELSLVDKTDNPESGYSSPAFPELMSGHSGRILPAASRKGKRDGRSQAKSLTASPLNDSDFWLSNNNRVH